MTDPTSLVDWLAGRRAGQLAAILEARRDVLWGAPLRGLGDLAARLSQPASVGNAVTDLPLPGLELLHTLAALGPSPTVSAAAAMLDNGGRTPQAQRHAVRAALTLLSDRALAWAVDSQGIDTEAVTLNPGAVLVLDRPLGLGRTVAGHLEHSPVDQLRGLLRNLGLPDASRREDVCRLLVDFLTDRDRVAELLATAPEAAKNRLLALSTADNAAGSYRPKDQRDREGENWARRRGPLFGGEYFSPEVPVEIMLVLRADTMLVSFDPDPPPLTTQPLTAAVITAGAAGAAAEFTETVAGVLDWIGRSPPPALKAGGIGAREITRIAKGIGSDDTRVRFALELARDLDLLGAIDDRVGISGEGRRWRAAEPRAICRSCRYLVGATGDAHRRPRCRREGNTRGGTTRRGRRGDEPAVGRHRRRWCAAGGILADLAGHPWPADGLATADQAQPGRTRGRDHLG